MAVIFTLAAVPITDPDFWWHLKTGQSIATTGSIPHTDIFSTLRFGSEWVTHEWLSEVLMYGIFRAVGYGGLIVFFSILITAAFWMVYLRCRNGGVHPCIAGFAVLLGAAATMPTWGVRPQMFSLLFASLTIGLLDRYLHHEKIPSIWWLAPIMILWVNLHAGFALGLVLIVLTLVGLFLDWMFLWVDSFADVWRHARQLCWLLLVSIAVVWLNPSGTRIYSYPFETLSSQAMMQFIQEWRSPDFHNPLFQALALLLLATFSALALSNKRAKPSQLLMLAATAWATLRSARNVAFFALVATPLLAEYSWTLISSHHWDRWFGPSERREPEERSAPKLAVNLVLLALVLTMMAFSVRRAVGRQPATVAREFPVAAVDFIQNEKLPQPIFNEYVWGGYLIWRLYPEYRVYIDGRADVYGDGLMKEFLVVNDGKPTWRAPLDSHGIRTALIKSDAPLASLLRQDSEWRKVFEDKQAVIFTR